MSEMKVDFFTFLKTNNLMKYVKKYSDFSEKKFSYQFTNLHEVIQTEIGMITRYMFLLQNNSAIFIEFNKETKITLNQGKYIKEAFLELSKYLEGTHYSCEFSVDYSKYFDLNIHYFFSKSRVMANFEGWYRNRTTKIHRPHQFGASLILMKNGIVIREKYLTKGNFVRDFNKGAGYIERHSDGKVAKESFYFNNEECLEREYNKKGVLIREYNFLKHYCAYYWGNTGRLQRFTQYDYNGRVHNPHGLAIGKYKNGIAIEELYYLNGLKYSKEKWEKERLFYL